MKIIKIIKTLKPFFVVLFAGLTLSLVGLLAYLAYSGQIKPGNIAASSKTLFSDFHAPRAYIVTSGSMEPVIKVGSIVVSYPSPIYAVGDVITFAKTEGSKNFITHRIEARNFPDGLDKDPVYQTSGDANEDFDAGHVKQTQVAGKVVLTLPYLGYVANFAKQPYGFLLLVIVPATIVIYEEFKTLFYELFKSFKSAREKYLKKRQVSEPVGGKRLSLPKLALFVPVLGAVLVIVAISAGFFHDKEGSPGNVLQAGTWGPSPSAPNPSVTPSLTPTPTPGVAVTLVINEVLPDSSCSQGNTEAQWLELYNGYPNAVNPKNFKITDGTNTVDLVTANNLSIPSGGFLLLAHSTAIWNSCYSDNGIQTGNLGGTLNIDVGQLRLIDTDGVTVIDTVIWGSNSLTPTQDQSIERNPDGWDSAFGTNFNAADFVIRTTPQPGL